MNEDLVKEAESLGINASLYIFLPPDRREWALRQDIERAKRAQTSTSENVE